MEPTPQRRIGFSSSAFKNQAQKIIMGWAPLITDKEGGTCAISQDSPMPQNDLSLQQRSIRLKLNTGNHDTQICQSKPIRETKLVRQRRIAQTVPVLYGLAEIVAEY
jgi:hypothetical protein